VPQIQKDAGLAAINGARIYYEIAGQGQPLVMIHAGVADHRQWNNEFAHFADRFRVVRYDMRGYGQSEPVAGEYSHLLDLSALLDYLHLDPPFVLMGCSMGGTLAMDLALARPSQVGALIMVGSGPSGLELDVPRPTKFEEAEKADEAGDLDRLAEIETQIWFDGMGRTPAQVDQRMRQLAYEMDRLALGHEAKELGKRLPNAQVPAAGRLSELSMPVLVIVGEHDIPFIQAAADYMEARIPSARQVVIQDAAHLSNMDQPEAFRRLVNAFLDDVGLAKGG
jgi:pimeloyl-ACP methyl ester carboxylesterase